MSLVSRARAKIAQLEPPRRFASVDARRAEEALAILNRHPWPCDPQYVQRLREHLGSVAAGAEIDRKTAQDAIECAEAILETIRDAELPDKLLKGQDLVAAVEREFGGTL